LCRPWFGYQGTRADRSHLGLTADYRELVPSAWGSSRVRTKVRPGGAPLPARPPTGRSSLTAGLEALAGLGRRQADARLPKGQRPEHQPRFRSAGPPLQAVRRLEPPAKTAERCARGGLHDQQMVGRPGQTRADCLPRSGFTENQTEWSGAQFAEALGCFRAVCSRRFETPGVIRSL
jgi:hypothetical protein